MEPNLCKCCSGLYYQDCCKPYHQKQTLPPTPETLMRARYCAYALHQADYLVATTHPSVRHLHPKSAILAWAKANVWLRLEICDVVNDMVEFKAFYMHKNQMHMHHERSTFLKDKQEWYYLKGIHS